MAREEGLLADTDGVIARLGTEKESLLASANEGQDIRAQAAAAGAGSGRGPGPVRRKRRMRRPIACHNFQPQRGALERAINEHKSRIQRLDTELKSLSARRAQLMAQLGDAGDGATLTAAVEAAVKAAQVF